MCSLRPWGVADGARCEVCGNDYDKAFRVLNGTTHTFDSFECAIHALAPKCEHCGCRVIGHGVEAHGRFFCCAQCPKRGRERGTYAFNGSGALGADCYVSIAGVAKFLPNAARTGGDLCLTFNFESRGSGPLCPPASQAEGSIGVLGGPYTYNGDGTVCENLHFIGGGLNGIPATFHTYLDPKGRDSPVRSGYRLSMPGRCGKRPGDQPRRRLQDLEVRRRPVRVQAAQVHKPVAASRRSAVPSPGAPTTEPPTILPRCPAGARKFAPHT